MIFRMVQNFTYETCCAHCIISLGFYCYYLVNTSAGDHQAMSDDKIVIQCSQAILYEKLYILKIWPIFIVSKQVFGTLHYIFRFLLLLFGQYLYWWTFDPRENHLHSSQCFDTDMVY
jgi:hypothetical protein